MYVYFFFSKHALQLCSGKEARSTKERSSHEYIANILYGTSKEQNVTPLAMHQTRKRETENSVLEKFLFTNLEHTHRDLFSQLPSNASSVSLPVRLAPCGLEFDLLLCEFVGRRWFSLSMR